MIMIVRLTLLTIVLLYPCIVVSGTDMTKTLLLSEDFSNLSSTGVKLRDGAVVEKQSTLGHVLHLEDNAYAEIKAPTGLTTNQGTISFWVKPIWEKESNESHTFLTMKWSGSDNSYMAISQGWWEPDGSGRLYFILSNQDHIHCSAPYKFQVGVWSMVTVTWLTGKGGHCRIYIDEELIAKHANNKDTNRGPRGGVFLGADIGSTSVRKRRAISEIRKLSIYSGAYSHKIIHDYYGSLVKSNPFLEKSKELLWGYTSTAANQEVKSQQIENNGEPRVIFDEDIRWALSKKNTDKILARIKSAGFNVYVPNVWHGRGTYFSTNIAHIHKRVEKRIASGDDPLAYLINRAHSLGIEVHPWFTVMKREDNIYPQFYDEGTPNGAYNVHFPEFRDFIVSLILDMVDRYPVDGINLDYIRSRGVCFSDYCAQDYNKKHGLYKNINAKSSLNIDYASRLINRSARKRVQLWLDEAVTDIVRRVSEGVRNIKPDIILSVDAHPLANGDRPLEGRDSIKWANMGLIDVIYNMDYKKRVDVDNHTGVRKLLNNPDKLFFLFGNYENLPSYNFNKKVIAPRNPELLKMHAFLVRRNWPKTGIAFYLYNMLSDEQIKKLHNEVFHNNVEPNWSYLKQ